MLRVFLIAIFASVAILPWLFSSDVVELVVRARPVLLGRYSMGHFGVAVLISLFALLSIFALSTKQPRKRDYLLSWLMIQLTTFGSLMVLVVVSGYLGKPRYVENNLEKIVGVDEMKALGFPLFSQLRQRPANQQIDYLYRDEPLQARSYPNAPPGYANVAIRFTTDQYGFRNQDLKTSYPYVAVGDSFVAGSHVSDQQAWPTLLSEALKQDVYNLGMSGTHPEVYLNNFIARGRALQPRHLVVMIYEGNDFKSSHYSRALKAANGDLDVLYKNFIDSLRNAGKPAQQEENDAFTLKKLERLAKASPITAGLKRLSNEYLEKINKDAVLDNYQPYFSWLPITITTADSSHSYAIEPTRSSYLLTTKQRFSQSEKWRAVAQIIKHFQVLAQRDGFKLSLIYAPSKEHVVLPLIKKQLSSEQLYRFLSFKLAKLQFSPEFKEDFFKHIDAQEQVFFDWCTKLEIHCVNTRPALVAATKAGIQTYFSYDQHWTPEGNRIAAEVILSALSEQPKK